MNTAQRLYRPPVSLFWWLHRRSYLVYALRELSSVFIAWFVAYLLLLVYSVSAGAERYEWFLDFSAHPAILALNVVALAFVLLHTVTWFGLAPKAMVLRVAGRRVPPAAILAAHYGGWVAVSAFVVWLVLR